MGLGRTSGPPAVGKSSGDISLPALQLRHGSRTIIKSHPALGLVDDVIQHERGGNEGDEFHHPRRSLRVRHSSLHIKTVVFRQSENRARFAVAYIPGSLHSWR